MPLSNAERLRRMVGDRIPPGGDETKTFFSNAEIDDLLEHNNDNLDAAALEGWLAKMAEFAKLIDQQHSGTTHKLSQMYKNAESMAKHYSGIVGAGAEAIIGRVVGRAINLRESRYGGLIPYDTVGRAHVGASSHRSELHNPEARRILANSHPDTMDEDDEYPTPGPVATS